MHKNPVYIGIDIGGTWLKGVAISFQTETDLKRIPGMVLNSPVIRVKSGLREEVTADDFIESLNALFEKLLDNEQTISGIGISTTGVVDYRGQQITITASHLKALKSKKWTDYLRERFQAPVVLINDADAAAIGAAAGGYLNGFRTIGVMPVGTGVGFSLWRNGRRWRPNQTIPLLGSIMTPSGSYDQVAGIAALAGQIGHDLSLLFSDPANAEARKRYEDNLANVIYTACVVYHTNLVLIGGGLAEAACKSNDPLGSILQEKINKLLSFLEMQVEVKVMCEGNALPLVGACLLAVGEQIAQNGSTAVSYHQISTESAYDASLELHQMDAQSIVDLLWRTEEEAGKHLETSLPDISEVAQILAKTLSQEGRLIYVGAGTSGRLAAIDTVELACTFGFPRERVYTLIAGGVADASIDIETNFEEDASAVPEMLLTGLNANDVVIGISVSGSAYYVQSALALAKSYGAYSVLIQESPYTGTPFCDKSISLNSGYELIAGSTRMKAGTATKKVLNFLSTTAMILMGKVYGSYMIEVECINQKLIGRAQNILTRLFGIQKQEAYEILKTNKFNLAQAIDKIALLKRHKNNNVNK